MSELSQGVASYQQVVPTQTEPTNQLVQQLFQTLGLPQQEARQTRQEAVKAILEGKLGQTPVFPGQAASLVIPGLGTVYPSAGMAAETQLKQAQADSFKNGVPIMGYDNQGKPTIVGIQPHGAKWEPGAANTAATSIPENLMPLGPDATPTDKEAFLAQLSPMDRALVPALANYDQSPTVASIRGNAGQRARLSALARMYDPTYDDKKYDVAKEYIDTNGKTGQQINALNTLAGHLGSFQEAMEQAKLQKLPLATAVVQFAQQQLGHPEVTDYRTAKEVIDSDLMFALGQNFTIQGLEAQGAVLPKHFFGEKQAEQYIKSVAKIASVRGNVLESGYKARIGKDPKDIILQPQSRQTLQRLLGNETTGTMPSARNGTVTMRDARGKVYQIPADRAQEAQADGLQLVR